MADELRNNQCRWIDSDPKDKEPWHWCSKRALPETPYCEEHTQVVYQKAKKKAA